DALCIIFYAKIDRLDRPAIVDVDFDDLLWLSRVNHLRLDTDARFLGQPPDRAVLHRDFIERQRIRVAFDQYSFLLIRQQTRWKAADLSRRFKRREHHPDYRP